MASRTNSAGEKPPTKCCKQKRYHQPDPGALTRVVRAVTRLGYAIDGQEAIDVPRSTALPEVPGQAATP
jgi:hypothetical protein